jgi:hypothetical protein
MTHQAPPGSQIDKDRPEYSVYSGEWEIGLAATANMLCRNEDEVRGKAKELGLEEHPGKRVRIIL